MEHPDREDEVIGEGGSGGRRKQLVQKPPVSLKSPGKFKKKMEKKQPLEGVLKEAVDVAFKSHVQDIIMACTSTSHTNARGLGHVVQVQPQP